MLATAMMMLVMAQAPCQTAAAPAAPAPVTAPAAAPPAAQPAPAPPPAAAPGLHIPMGALLQVELVDPLSSKTSKLGDRFAIRLAEPIIIDGVVVVPAGALGQGEVIDANNAGMSGSQGKLIISARYLDINGQHVRIRGMTLIKSGTSHVDLATGVSMMPYVGIAAIFIKGGEIIMPAGTRATVKVAEDTTLPATASTATTEKTQ
ncbi:MAG: hypothetical protein JWP35_262 [Caulobacter sp.]|nr:hypothetical protein [Caulobacter sp.]